MSNFKKRPQGFSTNAYHVSLKHGGSSVVAPIFTSTTFRLKEPETVEDYCYGRCANPTREYLENCLASIEDAKYGVAFASGVASIASVMHGMLKSGDHLIISDSVYSGTTELASELKNINVICETIDFCDLENVRRAMKSNTKMVWFETPTNPTMNVIDIEKCSRIAHSQPNVILAVDNTFQTPYFQRPLELGADVAVYSLTKYMNGHSDVVMGSAITNDEKIYARLKYVQSVYGAVPSPFDCYQVNRGLKTLALRMEQHSKSSLRVAEFLQTHPSVEKVIHPGLPSHPQYKLTIRQCYGHTGMISFYIKGTLKQSKTFLQSLRIVTLATSLGGVKSLAAIPSLMSHSSLPIETKLKLGITDNLVRLSIGLEDVDELIEDIDQALKLCQQKSSKL